MNATKTTKTRTESYNFGRKRAYANVTPQLIGRKAIYTTFDGEKLIGTITGEVNTAGGRYLTVKFDDGRHARLDSIVKLVREN